MKLLLLHGVGINSSRQKLTSLKANFDPNNVVVFESTNMGEAANYLVSTPLFLDENLVILENPPEDFSLDLSAGGDKLLIVAWFDHQVNDKKPVLEWVKKNAGEILLFSEEKEVSIFPLLDSLGYKDQKAYLKLAQLKKSGADTQYIITMIFYLLRTLAVGSKNAPGFVKEKIAKQKQNFPFSSLASLYKFVLEIDFKIKSGLLEENTAEFLLLNKFLS